MQKTAYGRGDHVGGSCMTKILLVMKLTTILLTVAFLNVAASGLSQNVSFSGKNVPLTYVFAEIEKQTGHVFVYAQNALNNIRPVTIQAENLPLETFLDRLLADQPLKYIIDYQTILLSRKPSVAAASPVVIPDNITTVAGDTLITFSGIVTDEFSNPIENASLVVKGTSHGTTANYRGLFTLKDVRNGAKVVVSAIGFEEREVVAGAYPHIVLKRTESKLDEVKVIAYGKTTSRYSTGNVARISGEELRDNPTLNVMSALAGRVPGLQVEQFGSHPATPVKLEIRGRNSVNPNLSGEPLFVVDGIPMTVLQAPSAIPFIQGVSSGLVQGGLSLTDGHSQFFGLRPEEIESIEVLKDADATAIYGSRGANGVIIINTRKPKYGKTNFNLQYDESKTFIQYPDMIDRETYFKIRREYMRNTRSTPDVQLAPDLTLWDTNRYIDWTRELMRNGGTRSIMASLEGGDVNNSFRISANYSSIKPNVVVRGRNESISARLGYRHTSLNGKFNFDLISNYQLNQTEAVRLTRRNVGPNAPAIWDSLGNPNFLEYGPMGNYPWATAFQPEKAKVYSSGVSVNAGYKLTGSLTAGIQASLNKSYASNINIYPLRSMDPRMVALGITGYSIFGETETSSFIVEPRLTYTRPVGDGELTAVLGTSFQNQETGMSSMYAMGYTYDELIESAGSALTTQVSNDYVIYRYAAVFGRLNYNLKRRYLATLNIRRDGSSRFGPGTQFGNFGSIGLGWILSEENWWKKWMPSLLDYFKIRSSYGISGNDGVGDYQYLSQWSNQETYGVNKLYSYMGSLPLGVIHPLNQRFHWESVKKLEVGLEMQLAQRFNVGISWYRDVCDDQLTQQPVAQFSGFGTVVMNSPAKVENKGLEGTFSAQLIRQKDLSWTFDFNIGKNWNKLLAYPNLERSPHANMYIVGKPLNIRFLYHYIGVDPLTGAYMFEDRNGDGTISMGNNIPLDPSNDAYVEYVYTPDFSGGFGSSVRWKQFSFNVRFTYRKATIQDPRGYSTVGLLGGVYLPENYMDNRWIKPGDITPYGGIGVSGSFSNSDAILIDGSQLECANMTLGWALPEKLLKQAKLKNASIFLKTDKLFTLTRHKGFLNKGFQRYSEIIPKTINLTFNVSL